MSKPELRSLPLYDLLTQIIVPFQKAKFNRLMILVDEPRLAGTSADFRRMKDELTGKIETDVLVTKLEAALGQAVYDATSDCRRSLPTSDCVSFVFSSLKPVYDPAGLKHETASGSGITWIDVASAGSSERSKLKQLVVSLLPRIPQAHREKSADFLMVMASGHWVSLVRLIECQRKVQPDIPVITYDIVRRVVVSQTRYVTGTPSRVPLVFGKLIKMSLLHERRHPFESWEIHDLSTSLVDLAYDRLILNSVLAHETEYLPIIPKLSLLDMEQYCANLDDVPLCDHALAKAVDQVLKVSGQSMRDPNAAIEPSWKALEHLTAAFIYAKFVALHASYPEKEFLSLTHASNKKDAFFSGHLVAYGDSNLSMKIPKQSRVIHVNGTGFRVGALPKKKPRVKKPKVPKKALQALVFEEKGVGAFKPGDIILPGIPTQPFCDCAVVFELERDKKIANCINFVQVKFSEKNSATTLTVATVASALTKLLKERGILFDCHEDTANQFARLGVKEENVILTFSVLRNLEPADPLEFAERVSDEAAAQGFQGSIVIADRESGREYFYGETFKDLTLLVESKYESDEEGGSDEEEGDSDEEM